MVALSTRRETLAIVVLDRNVRSVEVWSCLSLAMFGCPLDTASLLVTLAELGSDTSGSGFTKVGSAPSR